MQGVAKSHHCHARNFKPGSTQDTGALLVGLLNHMHRQSNGKTIIHCCNGIVSNACSGQQCIFQACVGALPTSLNLMNCLKTRADFKRYGAETVLVISAILADEDGKWRMYSTLQLDNDSLEKMGGRRLPGSSRKGVSDREEAIQNGLTLSSGQHDSYTAFTAILAQVPATNHWAYGLRQNGCA